MRWTSFKERINEWMNSSIRERQRILWLLPLLVVLCLLFTWPGKPRFERSFTLYSDAVSEHLSNPNPRNVSQAKTDSTKTNAFSKSHQRKETTVLFPFDPNTIDLPGLVTLGFSPKQAQVILNYRKAGAIFRRPEDFARCYTVSEAKFAELKPYIRIGESYRTRTNEARKPPAPTSTDPSSVSQTQPSSNAMPTPPTGNGTPSQTETPFDRDSVAGLASPSGLLELNSADSASLDALRGIGPLSAGRIVRYRKRLGGFARAEQLREVQGMMEENYQLILQQIFVDSSKIQKIDINFASPEQMAGHPYLPPRILDKILKYRQLKGGWSSIRALTEQHILSEEQAAKLAPYLSFRAR